MVDKRKQEEVPRAISGVQTSHQAKMYATTTAEVNIESRYFP